MSKPLHKFDPFSITQHNAWQKFKKLVDDKDAEMPLGWWGGADKRTMTSVNYMGVGITVVAWANTSEVHFIGYPRPFHHPEWIYNPRRLYTHDDFINLLVAENV